MQAIKCHIPTEPHNKTQVTVPTLKFIKHFTYSLPLSLDTLTLVPIPNQPYYDVTTNLQSNISTMKIQLNPNNTGTLRDSYSPLNNTPSKVYMIGNNQTNTLQIIGTDLDEIQSFDLQFQYNKLVDTNQSNLTFSWYQVAQQLYRVAIIHTNIPLTPNIEGSKSKKNKEKSQK